MPGAAPQSGPPLVGFAMRYVEARPAVRAPVIELPRYTGGTPMKRYAVAALLACCLGACAPPYAPPSQQATMPPAPPPEAAPPPLLRVTSEAQIAPGRWVVDQVRCSDLLGAADEDRETAAMFYYGYLAAKAGIRVIDVNEIDGNVRRVMDRCAAAPNITVPRPAAMRSAALGDEASGLRRSDGLRKHPAACSWPVERDYRAVRHSRQRGTYPGSSRHLERPTSARAAGEFRSAALCAGSV